VVWRGTRSYAKKIMIAFLTILIGFLNKTRMIASLESNPWLLPSIKTIYIFIRDERDERTEGYQGRTRWENRRKDINGDWS
jgi:hypothetical protein